MIGAKKLAILSDPFAWLRQPPSGAVLYLPLLEGGGSIAVDRSGKDNHGTITGATWVRLPSGLWVLSFDGTNDYVVATNVASLQITGDLTLEAWIYITAWEVAANTIFYKHYNNEFEASIDQEGAEVYGNPIYYHGDGAYEKETFADAASRIYLNTWTHVVWTRTSNSSIKFYKQGAFTEEETSTKVPTSSNNDVKIGYRTADYEQTGYIALPRIYNQALSAPEIASHYNQERSLFGV